MRAVALVNVLCHSGLADCAMTGPALNLRLAYAQMEDGDEVEAPRPHQTPRGLPELLGLASRGEERQVCSTTDTAPPRT